MALEDVAEPQAGSHPERHREEGLPRLMSSLFAPDPELGGAIFSPCRRWRYRLWRRWDPFKPYANFLMLNPSTADELTLDPTCTRCVNYCRDLGYGALIVTNLF